jgi:HD superfamily phosphodiesterase
MLVDNARRLAEKTLSRELPRRWQHVQAVAQRAAELTVIPAVDSDVLVAAAWLHDIGYAVDLALTGFHSLDGARYLRHVPSVPDRVACLVAHHSCALLEAEERGIDGELLSEFMKEESATSDALWCADMTTGPDGQHFDVKERLAEIRSRYGPNHLVTRFVDRAQTQLIDAVKRTQERASACCERGQLPLDQG